MGKNKPTKAKEQQIAGWQRRNEQQQKKTNIVKRASTFTNRKLMCAYISFAAFFRSIYRMSFPKKKSSKEWIIKMGKTFPGKKSIFI